MKRFIVVLLLWVSVQSGASASESDLRALIPDDLLRLEQLGDVALAPDAQTIAYVRHRPRNSAHVYGIQAGLYGNDRADVWLAPVAGGAAKNLTNGESDGSGYWLPTWSPDGAYLALLSTKGGNVSLWIWEKATDRLTKVSDRGLPISAVPPFAWLDDRTLAAVMLAPGALSAEMTEDRRTPIVAMREWPKAWSGQAATASVLDSGVPADLDTRPQQQLVLIDVAGKSRSLASATAIRDIRISPDARHIAFLRQVDFVRPDPATPLEHNGRFGFIAPSERHQLMIAAASGDVVMTGAKSARFAVPGSFQWSSDGRAFAFIGVPVGAGDDSYRVFRRRVGQTISIVPLPNLDPRRLAWAGADRLLISAEQKLPASPGRVDWWLVSRTRRAHNLTANFAAVPRDLLVDSTGNTIVGVADGDVWRGNLESRAWTNLTATLDPDVLAIVWPQDPIYVNPALVRFVPRASAVRRIVASARREALIEYYRIDIVSGGVTPIARPSNFATVVDYRPTSDTVLFTATERDGTYLTLVQGDQRRQLLELNTSLRDFPEGELRTIDYRGLDGQDLKAWLLLPPAYQSGTRYPLVTFAYAGFMASEDRPRYLRLNFQTVPNLQLLAARGYAVLMPSMPLPPVPDGKGNPASDPYMELTKGVLPAVEKTIDLGVADPDRLAVMGQSYGGYTTYGLVTLTTRFKAAIAGSGFTDLISQYGTFPAGSLPTGQTRYESFPHENNFLQSIAETSQVRMGKPPWKDFGRYLRNSPIFYVDRVQTPLLIIHGDMDFVPIQQAEEFFTALYRQGRRARFVRYWGEGHVTLESAANARDYWTQIYAWLDEFCDVTRDDNGNLVFDGERVKSRNGAPVQFKPGDWLKLWEKRRGESSAAAEGGTAH